MNHIRKELRSSLASIPGPATIEPKVCSSLVAFIQARQPISIGLFYPMPRWKELSLLFLEDTFEGQCAYPKVLNGQMTFHLAKSTGLSANRQIVDLREPSSKAPAVIPQLVFAPATACDHSGHRIGKGGGFYDRYLNTHPECLAIGVVDDRCLYGAFDPSWVQSHDHSMAFVLTQSQLFPTKETPQ